MAKAKMLGMKTTYIPNSRAATPGRKKNVMVQQLDKHSDTQALVKRYFETKEK